MKNIYVAIVQRPMEALDDTYIEVFRAYDAAVRWVDALLADDDVRGGYSVDQMNWDIFGKEVA